MDQSDIIQTYLNTQEYNPILNISSPMGNKYRVAFVLMARAVPRGEVPSANNPPPPLASGHAPSYQGMVFTWHKIKLAAICCGLPLPSESSHPLQGMKVVCKLRVLPAKGSANTRLQEALRYSYPAARHETEAGYRVLGAAAIALHHR